MQAASEKYKAVMKERFRNPLSHIRVTIGLINQEAQADAFVPEQENYTYYSSFKMPFDNYEVSELYAVCDQNYTTVDGSMYFLPRNREDCVLNQGLVSDGLLGPIEVRFGAPMDIKGLTIEFGKAYPVDFVIESDNYSLEVSKNADGHYVTEEIFEGATFLRFVPLVLVNGRSRFRICKLTMGIGIYFDNRSILSATKKEHISPITEELPTLDFDLSVDNKDRAYDIENDESTVNFLEIGQEISILYGQELEDGTIEWIPGATAYLREWSADDEEMSFTATDRFEDLDGTYYKGMYHEEGISLYALAVDVMDDAGVDRRTYWIDPYLKDVMVKNPLPVVTHKEALQLIANAGRCVLSQGRDGGILMKSSFIPDMTASSDNETYFSSAGTILEQTEKQSYSLAAENYTDTTSTQYFLPRNTDGGVYLDTGYVSEAAADANGLFDANPTVVITLESSFKCFGLTLSFGKNHPESVIFHAYLNGEPQEDYSVSGLLQSALITHEFPEFDQLILEFTKGFPNNRVILERITFGDNTDYELTYRAELTKTPRGTQLAKVRELEVVRTLYAPGAEVSELARETIEITSADSRYTFYFNNPSYDLSCSIADALEGQAVEIVESSSYFATVAVTGVTDSCEVIISGREYTITQTMVRRQLNASGSRETWENPLVSDLVHAADLADWIGDYMKSDREYSLEYRGEPRIDANDIVFLENKYVPDMLIRVSDHTLKFNGALSCSITARRDMSNVAAAKN